MDAVKNTAKAATQASSPSQFARGHAPPIQQQPHPGLEANMDPQPAATQLPTEDEGYQQYKAAGKLEGKKALITGGDSGIGRAVAILFAMEGATVAISYLQEEQTDAEETQRQVEKHGGTIHLYAADLSSGAACRTLVARVLQDLGGINVLVNNAAYQMMKKSIADVSEEQWNHTFDVNMHATFHLSKAVLPHLQRGDSILNNVSINAYVGKPDLIDYTATKGAMVAFTRALSNQVVGQGIRVNAVAPGPVWTPLIVATMDKQAIDGLGSTPMGRPGQPSEIATCFVFLASQDSSFISGQVLHPNGGVVVNG